MAIITEYSVVVSDENGCTAMGFVTVTPVDILCSNNSKGEDKLQVCFHGKSMCVAINAVDELLRNGAVLGPCSGETENGAMVSLEKVLKYPNPFSSSLTFAFTSVIKTSATIDIYSQEGFIVHSEQLEIMPGLNTVDLDLSPFANGVYQIILCGADIMPVSEIIIKQ